MNLRIGRRPTRKSYTFMTNSVICAIGTPHTLSQPRWSLCLWTTYVHTHRATMYCSCCAYSHSQCSPKHWTKLGRWLPSVRSLNKSSILLFIPLLRRIWLAHSVAYGNEKKHHIRHCMSTNSLLCSTAFPQHFCYSKLFHLKSNSQNTKSWLHSGNCSTSCVQW